MNLPAGGGLLLTGSGIYWILSSQLIASFTVLLPELFRGTSTGVALVLVVGIVAAIAGLWMINVDLDELSTLFYRKDGWVFTMPLILVVLDVSLTVLGLASGAGVAELNPFVSAAVNGGAVILTAYLLAYMALSQGVALLAVTAGRALSCRSTAQYLLYSFVCGAASFGPFSNLLLLINLSSMWSTTLAGLVGGPLFAVCVYRSLYFPSRS